MKTKLFSNILVVLFAIITISWSAYPQIVEGSDIVEQESIPYSDLSTHDTISYNEKQPAYGLQEGLQEELQPPLQISDLPDESDAGTQLMEDIQGMNIDDEENSAVPQEDELHSQIQEAPVQDTIIGTPLQMFNTENPEQAAPDQAQANQIEEEDNSDAVHSANDIYETGHTEEIDTEEIDTEEIDTEEIDTEEIDTEEIDTEETPIAQDIQGQDRGNTIAEEIPLVQSYTRNIESALE
jgi:RNase H-fold protein (predicted Holliday junction resolvase)